MTPWMRRAVALLVATVAVAAAALFGLGSPAGADRPFATARLRLADGDAIGRVRFYDQGRSTKVSVRIDFPRSVTTLQDFHGFHVHANDNPANGEGCQADPAAAPSTWFVSADGHFKAPAETHGAHKGDLQTLYLLANGKASATFYVDRFEPAELDGRAVIVHAGRDNYGNVPVGTAPEEYTPNSPAALTRTADTGNAGNRVACGVLEVG
jgi:superoxide dismutase, Cu-Zn family